MPDQTLTLSRIATGALDIVQQIFDDLSTYSMNVDGKVRRTCASSEFATACPAGTHLHDKHTFIVFQQKLPIGLLDIIDGYPVTGTAFIGLLAVRESLHGSGIGRSLYSRAEQFMRSDLHVRRVRIAVVEANPVIGFWQRMGFNPTGEVKPYEGEAVRSRSILMEKVLAPTFE